MPEPKVQQRSVGDVDGVQLIDGQPGSLTKPEADVDALQRRILELEERLADAEETLRALRNGEVDAVIVSGAAGDQIYTLHGADQTYRLFVEDMAEGALTLTVEGLIAFSNQQFSNMLGVPLEQLIGVRIQHFADPENASAIESMLSQGVSSSKRELTLLTSAGVSIPVYISTNRIEQDGLDCVCAVVTDLTQVKTRAMLADSEERFRTLVSIITDVPWAVDPVGRFVTPQPAWAAYTGQTWEQLRDFGWRSAFHTDDRQRVIEAWKVAFASCSLFSSQGRLWNEAKQAYRYVEIRATPLLDNAGKVREWVGTCTDVEDRKRFEAALQESAERLRFMAESMPQKIFTTRPDGSVDYLNKQWIEFTGLPYDALKESDWTRLIHPDDFEENNRLWQQAIQTGEFFQFIQRFRRWDGVYRWHLSRAQAMRDGHGKISMWIGSNTEIHEQKEIETELRRANDDLSQFAFAASHDLQEPLRMITSYAQLLANGYRDQLDERAAMCLRYIGDGTKQMRDLLDDLLAYTHIAGEDEQAAQIVDLNLVLAKAVENCKFAIDASEAVVTSDLLPSVPGHATRFLQIFQNLIGNAIKYRAAQPPRVHITADRFDGGWRVTVADNGMGIDPEYHHKIFGVFKRLHGKSIPGTGIGLAICQRIVERYGGRIWVESQVDQGAKFHFTLPSSEVPAP